MKDEFLEFLEAQELELPRSIGEALRQKVHADLCPPLWRIFLKVSGVHMFKATLTLLFCPQFGLSILPGQGLFAVFMRFGHHVCMAACGVTFIAGTALVSIWPWILLSMISLGFSTSSAHRCLNGTP